jgi:hypothetical protein
VRLQTIQENRGNARSAQENIGLDGAVVIGTPDGEKTVGPGQEESAPDVAVGMGAVINLQGGETVGLAFRQKVRQDVRGHGGVEKRMGQGHRGPLGGQKPDAAFQREEGPGEKGGFPFADIQSKSLGGAFHISLLPKGGGDVRSSGDDAPRVGQDIVHGQGHSQGLKPVEHVPVPPGAVRLDMEQGCAHGL